MTRVLLILAATGLWTACDGTTLPVESTYGLACGVDTECTGATVCHDGLCILPEDVPPDGGFPDDAGN